MDIANELTELYMMTSKHSNYQILPKELEELIGKDNIVTKTRYESERLAYILANVDVAHKTIIDIGANTGFFTFESLKAGADRVTAYEGNKVHAQFIDKASTVYGADKAKVKGEYYDFEASQESSDIVFCMNVLHHIGDDFGNEKSADMARKKILEGICGLSKCTNILILQLGFNWKGNVEYPLFDHGTKEEMIEFVSLGVGQSWDVFKIGIPERHDDRIVYCDLNEKNLARDDSMGEFLNRPLFILKRHKK